MAEKTLAEILSNPSAYWAEIESEERANDPDKSREHLYSAKAAMERIRDTIRKQRKGEISKNIYTADEYMSLTRCPIKVDGVKYDSIMHFAREQDWSTATMQRWSLSIREAIILGEPYKGRFYQDARIFRGGVKNKYRVLEEDRPMLISNLELGKNARNQKVLLYDAETEEFILEFDKMTDAAKWIPCAISTLSRAVRNGRPVKGFMPRLAE